MKVAPSIAAAAALMIHIVVAAVLFAVISATAVLLNLGIKFCEAHHLLPSLVIQGMIGLEMVLWAADVICFVLFLVVEVRKFCVTLWKERD